MPKHVDADTVPEEELAEAEGKIGSSPDTDANLDALDTLHSLRTGINRHLALLTPKERELVERLQARKLCASEGGTKT